VASGEYYGVVLLSKAGPPSVAKSIIHPQVAAVSVSEWSNCVTRSRESFKELPRLGGSAKG
jgi:hypothetical protein